MRRKTPISRRPIATRHRTPEWYSHSRYPSFPDAVNGAHGQVARVTHVIYYDRNDHAIDSDDWTARPRSLDDAQEMAARAMAWDQRIARATALGSGSGGGTEPVAEWTRRSV